MMKTMMFCDDDDDDHHNDGDYDYDGEVIGTGIDGDNDVNGDSLAARDRMMTICLNEEHDSS